MPHENFVWACAGVSQMRSRHGHGAVRCHYCHPATYRFSLPGMAISTSLSGKSEISVAAKRRGFDLSTTAQVTGVVTIPALLSVSEQA